MTRCSVNSDAADAGNFLTTVGMSPSTPAAGDQQTAHTTQSTCTYSCHLMVQYKQLGLTVGYHSKTTNWITS